MAEITVVLSRLAGFVGVAMIVTAASCMRYGPCSDGERLSPVADALPAARLYVGNGHPYEAGSLAVRTVDLRACEHGAPFAMRIFVPEPDDAYAVVVFQHGFVTRNVHYDEILRHLASHGFVVVAPQMYEPGLPALLGSPSAEQEARWATDLLDWLEVRLRTVAGVDARVDRLGLAGHSRGGKVAWLVLAENPGRVLAIAGVDPVDGAGGFWLDQPRVTEEPPEFSGASLIIGAGRGGSCSPEGINHEQFYEASRAPAWHVVAVEGGHADMLDPDQGALAAAVCPAGADPEGMRRLTAGLMTALFRGALQGDEAAFDVLTDESAAPVEVRVDFKPVP